MADNQLQINIGADTRNLEQGLQRATTVVENFDKSVKQTTASSGRATLALTNLGRVASDAPFGFIAIANNIEPLIQSFQSVRKESGSVGGALKALGGSLAGPGGLLLGFTLVSSAITVAIQKYGSLGNAISALLGNQTALDREVIAASKSYEKFNENLRTSVQIARDEAGSVAGQVARVQALSKIAGDQTIQYDKRNSALKELATINKGYFGELKIEDGLVKGLTTSVQLYTQSIIDSAKAKGFEAEISKLAPQIAEQQQLLDNLKKSRDNVSKTPVQTLTGFNKPIFTETQLATAAVNKQAEVLDKLKKRGAELEAELSKLVGAQVTSRIATEASLKAQKDKEEQDRKEAAAAAKLTEAIKRQAEARKKSLAEILERGSKVQTLDFTSFFDLDPKTAKEKYAKLFAPVTSAFEEALAPSRGQLARDIQIVPSESVQQAISSLNSVRDNVQLVSESFTTFLAPAIDGAFSALANGTSVIDAIKNSLKGLLTQLAANAAKALLLKAALSFVPGAGALTGGLGGAGGGLLSSLFGGGGLPRLAGAAAPSFGGISGFGGGLNLAGQVVFTQRGTDLVGVLNSSNARINRVG